MFESAVWPHKLLSVLGLLVLGMALLLTRNPDLLLDPIVFAEDGAWVGTGLTNGWLWTFVHARGDYFVTLNVAMLYLATQISLLITGNALQLLAESIVFVSLSFYSGIATLSFFVMRKAFPFLDSFMLYLLLLLIPLGFSQNEVIGRALQVGFYMPFLACLLIACRDSARSQYARAGLDVLLITCAGTNPVVCVLIGAYLAWETFRRKSLVSSLQANWFLLVLLIGFMLLIVPRLGGRGGIPGDFNIDNFIEVFLGRAVIYPFIFPWYQSFNDLRTVTVFLLWLVVVVAGWRSSRSVSARYLIILFGVSLPIYDVITLAMRPGLTNFLSGYHTSHPDRYLMGLNVFSIALTVMALSQLALSYTQATRILARIGLFSIIAIYASHIKNLFEINGPQMPLKAGFDFHEQLCLSVQEQDASHSIVPISPHTWTMRVPSSAIDKSKCAYVSIEETGIANNPGDYRLVASSALSETTPITLMLNKQNKEDPAGLKRIGIMIGTYSRKNPGVAEISLSASSGRELVQRFTLSSLDDNQYFFFDLDSNHYLGGKITSVSGGGISTWESHGQDGSISTCMVYEYNDGRRRFTPGCNYY